MPSALLSEGYAALLEAFAEGKAVTIEALEAYGANVKAGLARCMGMQERLAGAYREALDRLRSPA